MRIAPLAEEGQLRKHQSHIISLIASQQFDTAISKTNSSSYIGLKAWSQQEIIKGMLASERFEDAEKFANSIADTDDRSDALLLILEKLASLPNRLEQMIRVHGSIVNPMCREGAQKILEQAQAKRRY
jgi:hypothetical protein